MEGSELVPAMHPLHMLLLRLGENRLLGPTFGEISLATFASVTPLPANGAALLPVLQVPADKHLQDEHLH